ncbi:C-type lectin domain family 2 member D-like [Lissotriton helveticus]
MTAVPMLSGAPLEAKLHPDEYFNNYRKPTLGGQRIKIIFIGGVIVVLAVLVVALIIALSVLQSKPCDYEKETKQQILAPCADGWIFYLGTCYFFSEKEGNWTDSQRFCDSHDASLAVIATQKEMDFIMRFKGLDDHWIGLSREPMGEWKWSNGTKFNNWFDITGDSNCAYLNHQGAKNARCYGNRKWICTIGDILGQRMKSIFVGGANLHQEKT